MTILTSSVSSSYGWGVSTVQPESMYIAYTSRPTSSYPLYSTVHWQGGNNFTNVSSVQPSGVSSDTPISISFHPSGNAVLGLLNVGTMRAWQWNQSTGFGSEFSNPASANIVPFDAKFSSSGNWIGIAINVAPGGRVMAFDTATGFSNTYTTVSAGSSTNLKVFAFTDAEDGVAVVPDGFDTTTRTFDSVTGSVGTASSKFISTGQGLGFNKNGNVLIVGTGGNAQAYTYDPSTAILGSSAFSTVTANTGTSVVGSSTTGIYFSPDNTSVVLTFGSSSTAARAFEWNDSTGFGNPIGNTLEGLSGIPNFDLQNTSVRLSKDGRFLITTSANTIKIWEYSSTTGIGPLVASYSAPSGTLSIDVWQPT